MRGQRTTRHWTTSQKEEDAAFAADTLQAWLDDQPRPIDWATHLDPVRSGLAHLLEEPRLRALPGLDALAEVENAEDLVAALENLQRQIFEAEDTRPVAPSVAIPVSRLRSYVGRTIIKL